MFSKYAAIAAVILFMAPATALARRHPRPNALKMVATAYAQHGITRSGEPTIEWWTVAADPRVLPLGTRIFVRDPKGRSGEYVVSDTGRKVKGRHIDIFIPDLAEAREFGRHRVTVEVLEYPGQNVRASLRRSAAGGE